MNDTTQAMNDPRHLLDAAVPQVRRTPVECGDLPFLIRRDGSWLYRGSPINRKELVCLFASVLKRDAEGAFWLETPAERGRIVVEDAPFLAVALDWTGVGETQVLTFRTNVDQMITAGAAHQIRVSFDLVTCEPIPYLTVRPGAGRLPVEARIGRAVYYELVALAEPGMVHGKAVLGVWSEGCFFALGDLPPEDDGADDEWSDDDWLDGDAATDGAPADGGPSGDTDAT